MIIHFVHVGNAMGYVRMMRSGGIHCCSNASIFLPVVDANLNIQKLCEVNKLSEVTVNAAKNLECDINHLRRNYAEGTEYFRVRFLIELTTSQTFINIVLFIIIL